MSETYQDKRGGRRKGLRREFHYAARLIGGESTTPWNGFVLDISDGGAQLEVLNPQDVPDEFDLLIGGKSDIRRRCRVIWRSQARIGVRFIRPPARLPASPNASFWARQRP
jgi:PilZ domain-containing protein